MTVSTAFSGNPAGGAGHGAAQLARVDARPILQRSADGIWVRAEQVRDDIHNLIQQACVDKSIDALVLKSNLFVQPPWVKFECWLPCTDREVTERISAIVTVVPKPYHELEYEYNLEIENRGKKTKYDRLVRWGSREVADWMHFLLNGKPRVNYKSFQVRQSFWQFWRPRNRMNALTVDWARLIPAVLVLLGLVPISALLGQGYEELGYLPNVVLFGVAGLAAYLISRRKVVVRTTGKPPTEPRFLIRVDSWQAVIFGAGSEVATVRKRIRAALKGSPREGFRQSVEKIWYWGLDGKEERDQLVLTSGRGILFCQVYQYDRELYVGWDAHLNRGQWVEKTVGRGIDRQARRVVKINTVVAGTQPVSEYDVTDLSCLIEWSHAQIVQIIKQFMEERQIDQEIDFKIQRGDRQGLTADPQQGGIIKRSIRRGGEGAQNVISQFKRTA